MEFKTVEVEEYQDKLLVTVLEKRVYLGITSVFREEVQTLLTRDVNEIVFDLKNVSVMNSSGLGVLIMARDSLNKRGGQVKLANLQTLMQEIFSRMRLDTLFSIYPNAQQALTDSK
ncbi:MAG: STAS domain-containing protein [Calditrichaeota bacterium]|nr:STAS domain-containing protein [Calditrichota bacterium]